MARKNRLFAKLASDIDTSGNLIASGISSDVTLGGATIYSTRANLPASGNAGDQAYVTENNRLYIWNGSGWYNIALINLAPSIQSVLDSDGNTTPFILAIDGTPTSITITATDSDGDPITYSAVADSDFGGLATISQADNVFTVTPLSRDSATTESGTITFKADDGVNIASSINTFTLNFLSEYWDETVLSIGTSSTDGLNNSTFIDRSTNAHTVTPSGTPDQTAFHPYLDNWSVEFDGTTSNIPYIANDTAFNVAGGDYTVEFWFFADGGIVNTRMIMFSTYDNPNGGIIVNWDADNTLSVSLSGDFLDIDPDDTISYNEWHHVAISSVHSGTTTLYLDGVSIGTTSNSTANGIRPLVLGALYVDFNNTWINPFSGYISNVRIVKGTALYTSNFTPSTEKLTAVTNTTVLTAQSNRFVETASDLSFTFRGSPKISAFNPFGQESEYAVGENKGSVFFNENYTTIPTNADLNLGSSDFTLETWIYLTEYPPNYSGSGAGNTAQFFVKDTLNAREYGFALNGTTSSYTTITYTAFTSNTNAVGISASYNFNLFEWYHIAFSRNGNSTRIYVNGVDVGGGTSANPQTTNSTLYIGQDDAYWSSQGYQYYFYGYLSDLKLVKGTALYTSNFTPPSSPVGNTNASLYLPFDNAGIFDKTGNHTLTLSGDTSTSTTQTKFADTAMYFDGNGDRITITDHNFYPNTNLESFTIEAWIYPTNSSRSLVQTIVSSWSQVTGSENFILALNTSAQLVWYWEPETNASAWLTSSTTVASNQWTHVAVTRDSSTNTHTLYINGQNVAQGTSSTTSTDSYQIDIGYYGTGLSASTSSWWGGYLEGLQLLKGVAKYTTNFTPPDRTQGRTYQATS